jgi:hypothetical protein
MKNYVLNMSGHECAGISAHEISELFHQGAIERDTPCRRERSSIWKTVDEILPILSLEPRRAIFQLSHGSGPIRRAAPKLQSSEAVDAQGPLVVD